MVVLLIVGAVAGPIAFVYYRRTLREQKNFERGLKMVPLLIHLPPPSDDIQGGGRDQRDLTDETISKAQIIYNIIASTIQKGFKAKFYGQRHFAFEIVGSHGFVYFYAAVPVALVEVVKQAVVSAYPTARLEEVAEHNIFSPVGRLGSTVGGEMVLKSHFAYPIATFQDLKRDAMQSILNALSTLDKEDGAGIQILMRPADPDWRKEASSLASNKRKDKDNKGGAAAVGGVIKDLAVAFNKPPESKDDKPKEPKELSALEQQQLDAIDDKTRHPGYEVLIRVVASSNISSRAQAILTNVIATFNLFDAPGKNGFKYMPAKDMESFVTGYIMRFFPQHKRKMILNAVELATLFHFPDQQNTPTSQVARQMSKQVDGPRNMPDEGLLLGYNVFRGVKKPVRLALGDRQRHMYAVGQTGTGKSTFLENLALQDMLSGNGFAFIDPHGDTAEKLLAMVPKERTEDVIYFSPADMDYPMGLNLFEFNNPDQKDFLIQETLNMLQKLYDPTHQGIMGPRYEHIFRNAALAIMADPAGGTFVDIPKLFRDPVFLKQKLAHVTDNTVLEYWQKEYPASQRSNDAGEVTAWFVSKFGAFLSNEMMRNIIGQTKSAFDLRDIMDNKKILLVNLSKGRVGDLNSKLLGMIFVMKFQAAAMSRASIPEKDREDFALYVDEFQNFSTDSFATIMSEARKYHLNLIVANQFTTQLTEEIRDAVFGNMGTIVAFRVGQNDVEGLAKYFQPAFEADDLLRVPNYNSIVRTLIGGVPTNPFSMAALPPLGNPNMQLAEALKQLTAAKYGKPRAEVEKEVFARLATKEEPKPAFGAAPGGFGAPAGGAARPFGGAAPSPFGQPQSTPGASPFGPSAGPSAQYGLPQGANNALPVSGAPRGAAMPPGQPGGGSFLDDWLSKRQQTPAAVGRPMPTNNNQYATIPQTPMPAGSYPQARPASGPMAASDPMQPMTVRPSGPAEGAQPILTPSWQSHGGADGQPLIRKHSGPLYMNNAPQAQLSGTETPSGAPAVQAGTPLAGQQENTVAAADSQPAGPINHAAEQRKTGDAASTVSGKDKSADKPEVQKPKKHKGTVADKPSQESSEEASQSERSSDEPQEIEDTIMIDDDGTFHIKTDE